MSHFYPAWNGIQVLPEDLIKFAWSEPMRDLAAKIGMSDVGRRKLFVSMDVVPPPQGYWNKLGAGKPVPEMPRTQPRKPAGKHKVAVLRGDKRPDPDLPAGTPLQLRYKVHPGERTWNDDKDGKLETKIAAIVADLIVAGEAGFRERLRQTEIQLEKDRIAAEERRQNKLEELNARRVDDLIQSGESSARKSGRR